MPLQGCMQTSASRDQLLSWVRSDFIVLESGRRVQFKESMQTITSTVAIVGPVTRFAVNLRFVPSA